MGTGDRRRHRRRHRHGWSVTASEIDRARPRTKYRDARARSTERRTRTNSAFRRRGRYIRTGADGDQHGARVSENKKRAKYTDVREPTRTSARPGRVFVSQSRHTNKSDPTSTTALDMAPHVNPNALRFSRYDTYTSVPRTLSSVQQATGRRRHTRFEKNDFHRNPVAVFVALQINNCVTIPASSIWVDQTAATNSTTPNR